MKIQDFFRRPTLFKLIAVFCPIIFILGMFIGHIVQPYRGTWIYRYGLLISLLLSFGAIPISVINSLFIVSTKFLKNKFIFLLIGLFPLLYFIIMFAYLYLRDYEIWNK